MAVRNEMFSLATNAAPGRPNEDFAVVTPELAIVIDGAGVPMAGCHHGVAWYARQLGTQTAAALTGDGTLSLSDGLAAGIRGVAALHAGTCDLNSPNTPCAAVGILRIGPDAVETLALSDAVVVVDLFDDGPQVTCDLSIEEHSSPEPVALAGLHFGTSAHQDALTRLVEAQTATRNRVDGWWVASNDPGAAYHALTKTYPRSAVRRMAVFSDGATRPVDQMGLYKWPAYLDLLDKLGPRDLIGHVRTIESEDPDGDQFPRTKRHDDATAVQYIAD